MIVTRMASVVAIAFYAVDEERRNSAGGRRGDDIDVFVCCTHGFANLVARALGGEIFGSGDRHAHGYAAGDVGHVILVSLTKPTAIDSGALGEAGQHGSHGGVL